MEKSEENNVDITNKRQHGYKKNKGTLTIGLELQSIISRALDESNYVLMASLDLSAAFDVVNNFNKKNQFQVGFKLGS